MIDGPCHPFSDGEAPASGNENENEREIGGVEGEIANESGVPWLAPAPVSVSETGRRL